MIISFVCVIVIKRLLIINEHKNVTFFIDKNHSKFNLVNKLVEIIEAKAKQKIEIKNFVNREVFNSLGLIEAPVYIIKAKCLGVSHLKLYEKALNKIRFKINVVVLNGNISLFNKYVNLIYIVEEKLDFMKISLLNILNTNKQFKQTKLNFEKPDLKEFSTANFRKNYYYNFENLDCEARSYFIDSKGYIELDKNSNLFFKLENNPFGFIMKGSSNKIEIYNIFHELILIVKGNFKAVLSFDIIKFKTTLKSILEFNFCLFKEYLELLKFNIKCEDNSFNFGEIKNLALDEINKNFFVLTKEIEPLKTGSLSDYFKCVFLRKKYFNDYINLLKNVFCLTVTNSILTVKPKEIITKNFSISYDYNGEQIEVKFGHLSPDMVKLSHVGHKIGVKEKYVFEYS